MPNAPLTTVLRHLQQLASTPGIEALSDGQLLERFDRRRDEAAFTALVRRHGPLVLGVCRRILRHGHDVEDAFQATFLVLFRRARALDRSRSLAGWLYTVAYHVALRARTTSARRQQQERQVTDMPQKSQAEDVWRELQPVLDEELNRLPDKYREPILLCYLEGKTNEEAARLLRCPTGTLKTRLARARELLRARLTRRGVALSSALLIAVLAERAAATVPPVLIDRTVKTTLALAAGTAAGGLAAASANTLAEGMLKTMLMTKLKLATAVLLVLSLATLVAGAFSHQALAERPPGTAQQEASASAPQPVRTESQPPGVASAPRQARSSGIKEMTVVGRVLDPQGKPLPGAEVAVVAWTHDDPHEGEDPPRPEVWAKTRADDEGRFEIAALPRNASDYYRNRAAQVALLAGAAGHGVGWQYLQFGVEKTEATVRLHPEQVLHGRLIDLQGASVVGARVEVVRVGKPAPRFHHFLRYTEDERRDGEVGVKATDNDTATQLWEEEVLFTTAPEGLALWPKPATTDKEGRFSLRGVGRNETVMVRTLGNERAASEWLTFDPNPDADPKEVTFSAAAPCFITGTVTDAETGRPVLRAAVQVEASGSTLFLGQWPLPADWKGRQHLAGQGTTPSSRPIVHIPAVRGQTDDQGRFRISPFRNLNDVPVQYTVIVLSPDGQAYLPVRKMVKWPKGVLKQEVAVSLPRGVRVRGRVMEAPSGEPVSGARVDFWSKQVPVPQSDFVPRVDGPLYPLPVHTDPDGRFEMMVPAGPGYLLVNCPGTVYRFTKIAAEDLGVKQYDVPDELRHMRLPPGKREEKKPHYYPDELVALDRKPGTIDDVTVTLHRAPLLQGRVLGPDDKPAKNVKLFQGHEPFLELSHGAFSRPYEVRDGQFSIPVRNPEAPLCLAFLDVENQLGVIGSFTAQQADAGPVTLRLAPCGSATARLVDAQKKPLAKYRPLFWMSLPKVPYTTAGDLERAGLEFPYRNYDAVWMSYGDEKHYAGGPRTDEQGNVTFPALIPGATYRLSQFGGKVKDFTVEPGKKLDLGDILIYEPEKTKDLPGS